MRTTIFFVGDFASRAGDEILRVFLFAGEFVEQAGLVNIFLARALRERRKVEVAGGELSNCAFCHGAPLVVCGAKPSKTQDGMQKR